MTRFIPAPLRGVIAAVLLAVNTVFWCALLYIPALLKLIIPWKPWRVFCTQIMIVISECWVACNNIWIGLTPDRQWIIKGAADLERRSWYLVISNHQSWVDIFAMQKVFNRRAPFLKFFLKQQLLWVPVIGLAWWGLDFPFMKRHSAAYLARHPEARGQDRETTRKACEKFRFSPVSVMNFVEGTRFTPAKHTAQKSPYRHLLRPKAGGTAFVLDAMGEMIDTLVNITIVYPDGPPTLWQFLCGRVQHLHMELDTRPIPESVLGPVGEQESAHRNEVKAWLNGLWEEKDARIEEIFRARREGASPVAGQDRDRP
ncbi:MAG: acyltransferase [Alteromonadaceae bacterium]|nr:acyltransferase [Alteromonadaceae bacterium]